MKAKKSLGQNFLKSNLILDKIIKAGEIDPDNLILEIGPGKGALTSKLLEKAGKVIAIEKDHDLFELLKIKFEKEIKDEKLILIEEDILELNVNEIFSSFLHGLAGIGTEGSEDLKKTSKKFRYKIIANIPYNITGAILKKFLGGDTQPTSMVLLVQQEVAQRIVARDKKESLLSISVKAYGEPKIVAKVGARYFSPQPKVDSSVIVIKNISKRIFYENKISEEDFWKLVKLGFAHKRKKLSGNLKSMNLSKNSSFEDLKDKRAENLSPKDWITLSLLT
ncbi:MAG: 16S rRNA (adenine(1518)-N(6)/adenine(1519)-N(6))-dimethyltransferase RsmA [Patescibacteria group bacterium]